MAYKVTGIACLVKGWLNFGQKVWSEKFFFVFLQNRGTQKLANWL
jgi:hypothetical protein